MSIKIERLAKNICDEIRSEIDNMSAEEFSTFDSERLIIEEIDRQMPTSNWEYIEYLKDDTDLGFESDTSNNQQSFNPYWIHPTISRWALSLYC